VFYFAANPIPLGISDDDGIELTSLALAPCEPPTDEEIEEFNRREVGKDLAIIVRTMKLDQSMSSAQLADLVKDELRCEARTAKKRINAAVPGDEWTRTTRLGKQVEIMREVPEKTGQSHRISLRVFEE
jgi:hypothetical protein